MHMSASASALTFLAVSVGLVALIFFSLPFVIAAPAEAQTAKQKAGLSCDQTCNADALRLCKSKPYIGGRVGKRFVAQRCYSPVGLEIRTSMWDGLVGKPCLEDGLKGKCIAHCNCRAEVDMAGKKLNDPSKTKSSAFQQWASQMNRYLSI